MMYHLQWNLKEILNAKEKRTLLEMNLLKKKVKICRISINQKSTMLTDSIID